MFRLHCTTYVLIRWWRFQMVTLEHLEMVWRQDWWFSSMRRDDQVSQRLCDVPAALWPHQEAAASAWGTETKCGSGLAQRCAEAAGKTPHSLPHMYLLQRPDTKTSRSRCEGLSGLVERSDLAAASPESQHFWVWPDIYPFVFGLIQVCWVNPSLLG